MFFEPRCQLDLDYISFCRFLELSGTHLILKLDVPENSRWQGCLTPFAEVSSVLH
jgi:hypothetical protein